LIVDALDDRFRAIVLLKSPSAVNLLLGSHTHTLIRPFQYKLSAEFGESNHNLFSITMALIITLASSFAFFAFPAEAQTSKCLRFEALLH
jgi:hypothetical protein